MEIFPLKTPYNGIVFRSKLEAKWAVFFDAMKVKYRYEPWVDEVDFGPGLIFYKPDFYLPDLDTWIEVKPDEFRYLKYAERIKAEGWAREYGSIVILSGPPRTPSGRMTAHTVIQFSEKLRKFFIQEKIWWCECPKCGRVDLRPDGGVPARCEKECFSGPEVDLFGEELPEVGGHKSARLRKACSVAEKFDFNKNVMDRRNVEKESLDGHQKHHRKI